jgi:hypothetical protein
MSKCPISNGPKDLMQTVSVPTMTPEMQEIVDFGKEFMESMKHSPFYLGFPASKTNGLFR